MYQISKGEGPMPNKDKPELFCPVTKALCFKGACGWWDKKYPSSDGMCAVLTIARSIDELELGHSHDIVLGGSNA